MGTACPHPTLALCQPSRTFAPQLLHALEKAVACSQPLAESVTLGFEARGVYLPWQEAAAVVKVRLLMQEAEKCICEKLNSKQWLELLQSNKRA